jgi:hypothetical protein
MQHSLQRLTQSLPDLNIFTTSMNHITAMEA